MTIRSRINMSGELDHEDLVKKVNALLKFAVAASDSVEEVRVHVNWEMPGPQKDVCAALIWNTHQRPTTLDDVYARLKVLREHVEPEFRALYALDSRNACSGVRIVTESRQESTDEEEPLSQGA